MNAKSEPNTMDIIYPNSMKEANPKALALCEGFITKLLQLNAETLKIKINNRSNLVECNNRNIKNFLDLLLKSKNLDLFYRQFILLLHRNELELKNSKRLVLYQAGEKIKFEVKELKSLPDVSLEVWKTNE